MSNKIFDQFPWLRKCEVTDSAVLVIVDQLKTLTTDVKDSMIKNKLIFHHG